MSYIGNFTVEIPYIHNAMPRSRDMLKEFDTFCGWLHHIETETAKYYFFKKEDAVVFKLKYG